MIKDGVKTTEFWYMVVALIANLLVIAGYLPSDDADKLTEALFVVVNCVMSVAYGGFRSYLKL